jgi:hypothetical protein
MTTKGGIETNIEQGMIARVIAGARYALTGKADWFGPGQPLEQTAPEEVRGRQFQMPISVNTLNTIKPEGISFQQLRVFADTCEIVRLLIETRKDQLCSRSWRIKNVDDKVKDDPEAERLQLFFKRPDKDHCWSDWLRMYLEDVFVLDAPVLYWQTTVGGDLYALRPIDGATIKRIIDTHGWTPQAPDPAYQQVLQGLPATNYSTDELIYRPRNPRTNRIYGYSPTEQVIITARLLLSRAASNLEYYENGNLPEGFIEGAPGWTPSQLKEYQNILDGMLSGNLAERRKARAIPNGSKYTAVKEPALKAEFDEWLARIACFAFSYPATPFIKQMNRSTSDNAKESASEEGIEPFSLWVKETMDGIIQIRLKLPNLEFTWDDAEAQDPKERAEIDKIYIDAGVLKVNEVRLDLGREPLTDEEIAAMKPVPPAIGEDGKPLPPGQKKPPIKDGAKPEPPDDAEKLAKAVGDPPDPFTEGRPVDLDRPAAEAAREKVAGAVGAAFDLAAADAAASAAAMIATGETNAALIAGQVDLDALGQANAEIEAGLLEVAKDAADDQGFASIVAVRVDLVNDAAVAWAKERAADLITADGKGGALISSTRDLIRTSIADAVESGASSRQLAAVLRDSFAFSKSRAMTIARTEIAGAAAKGSMLLWINSGKVVGKRWLLGEKACIICQANAAQGVIPLMQAFISGHMTTPGHPNCVCTISPITE